jgi:hypothetical protein
MAGRGPQTFKKRQKEQQRKEKQEHKREKRLERKLNPGEEDESSEYGETTAEALRREMLQDGPEGA